MQLHFELSFVLNNTNFWLLIVLHQDSQMSQLSVCLISVKFIHLFIYLFIHLFIFTSGDFSREITSETKIHYVIFT